MGVVVVSPMQSTASDVSGPPLGKIPSPKGRTFEVKPKGSWKQLVGWNKDCVHQQEALKLGAAWREQENQRDG